MADDKNNGMQFINQDLRGDDHAPLGPHINYEVKLNLKGYKEGRQVDLSNTHIPLSDSSND